MKNIEKIIMSCVLFFGLCIAVNAQDSIKVNINPNAPEITFEKDIYDFGNIKNEGNGTYEFKFKNTGKEPLIISDAKGSCGCTVPSWPKELIKPGASGIIKVTYDTKRTGGFIKTVTITSNAKTQQKVITIKGNVEPPPVEEPFPGKQNGAIPYENHN